MSKARVVIRQPRPAAFICIAAWGPFFPWLVGSFSRLPARQCPRPAVFFSSRVELCRPARPFSFSPSRGPHPGPAPSFLPRVSRPRPAGSFIPSQFCIKPTYSPRVLAFGTSKRFVLWSEQIMVRTKCLDQLDLVSLVTALCQQMERRIMLFKWLYLFMKTSSKPITCKGFFFFQHYLDSYHHVREMGS